jgi:hypothetical protein
MELSFTENEILSKLYEIATGQRLYGGISILQSVTVHIVWGIVCATGAYKSNHIYIRATFLSTLFF